MSKLNKLNLTLPQPTQIEQQPTQPSPFNPAPPMPLISEYVLSYKLKVTKFYFIDFCLMF